MDSSIATDVCKIVAKLVVNTLVPLDAIIILAIDQYGLHTTLRWKRQEALFYGVGKGRLMSMIVVEDLEGKRGRQVQFCSNTNWSLQFILCTYASRWSIDVTFENLKQLMGFADAKVKAITRFSQPHLLTSRRAAINPGRYAKLELRIARQITVAIVP